MNLNNKLFSVIPLLILCLALSEAEGQQTDNPLPNKQQLAWQEAELGFVFHYDLHVFDGRKYGQGSNRISPFPDYQLFNPEKLNTDQWIKAAKAAGGKFAILTVTHETGFALYQSDVNPYCLKAVKWKKGKGDIVRDFVKSCRKYGLKPGLYIGIRWNSFFGVHDFIVNGEGKFRDLRQKYYNRMVEGMVTELCTNYGPLFEIWFDGGASHPEKGAPDVLPIVKKYQPECLFYHNSQLAEARWGGSETGTVGYPCWAAFPYPDTDARYHPDLNRELLKHGDPEGKYWVPAMSDAPLRGINGRHEWFWEPGDENNLQPLENLMNMYYKSVGRNSTLIIGLTPDPQGLIPNGDVLGLKEFGTEISKRFARPLAAASGSGNQLVLSLPQVQKVNHVIIQEKIKFGERVREYTIEAGLDGKWIPVCKGESIGNKRIQQFKTVRAEKLRLTVTKSASRPMIKFFKGYYIKEATR